MINEVNKNEKCLINAKNLLCLNNNETQRAN